MGLSKYLGQIAPIMAPIVADDDLWSYTRAETGETLTVTAFLKYVQTEQDGFGIQTKRQRIPVVRAMNLPWSDEEIAGANDIITAPDGTEWRIADAYERPSGWTDLHVSA